MKIRMLVGISGIIGSLFFADQTVWSATDIPGSAMPEQVSRALRQEQLSRGEQPAEAPVVSETEKGEAKLAEQAKKITFKLKKIILVGNHVYTDEQLSLLYRDKLNKTIPVSDLFEIVQRITNFYRNNGYILSRAILPPQHVKEGTVTIRIIEGYIDKVHVSGTPHGATNLVQAFGEKIRKSKPLQLKTMEYYLLLANEIPATEVRAVLSPSKTMVGAADLTLVTKNKPITGYISYDNYGTRYIGPQQITGNINLNSIFIPGDVSRFTLTKTPKGKELSYIDFNYGVPVWSASGMRWLLGGTRAKTNPQFVLGPLKIIGRNENYYTLLQYPMIRSRSQNFNIIGGFNYLDSRVTTFGEELYTDHLRPISLGFTYNFADRFYGSNFIGGEIKKGLPILGYTSDTSATALTSRLGGEGNFIKVDAQLSRVQAIYGPLSVYGIAKGQYAFVPLLASEQFTFGGPILGRGYDVAELIGDRGAAGSLEGRYDLPIQKFYIQNIQFYVFYDLGVIWNIKFVEGQPKKQSATSTGFGARFYMNKYVNGNFIWAQPLTKQVAAEQLIGDGWRPRMFFSLVANLDY